MSRSVLAHVLKGKESGLVSMDARLNRILDSTAYSSGFSELYGVEILCDEEFLPAKPPFFSLFSLPPEDTLPPDAMLGRSRRASCGCGRERMSQAK